MRKQRGSILRSVVPSNVSVDITVIGNASVLMLSVSQGKYGNVSHNRTKLTVAL